MTVADGVGMARLMGHVFHSVWGAKVLSCWGSGAWTKSSAVRWGRLQIHPLRAWTLFAIRVELVLPSTTMINTIQRQCNPLTRG